MSRLALFGVATAVAMSAVTAATAETERPAADMTRLRAVIGAAKPGDVIVMKNGTWPDAQIVFDASGTERAPVRLRAETPGGVILTGSSRLTFAAPHLVVEGLFFKGGALAGGSVVEFASHHGRLAETAIVETVSSPPMTWGGRGSGVAVHPDRRYALRRS